MALSIKLSRVNGVEDHKHGHYVTVDFKSSLYRSEVVESDGDCLNIEQNFTWPLGSPLSSDDMIAVKLYYVSKSKNDKYLAVLQISLEQVIQLGRLEINEVFVEPETNQPSKMVAEMELIYSAPEGDTGEEALQRALLQQIGGVTDQELENYDRMSLISSTTVTTQDETTKRKKKGIMSRFGLKSKAKMKAKSIAESSDAISVWEMEPMLPIEERAPLPRKTVAFSSSHFDIPRWRQSRLEVTVETVTSKVTSKSVVSQIHNNLEDLAKFDKELSEFPSPETLSSRKRIERLYKCKHYDAVQLRSFQIHVTIVEARQLSGQNIDPVVSVQIGTDRRSTAVKTSTNQPYFNDFMVFDLRHPLQALLDQVVTVSVWHSKKLLSDEMIGQFRIDLATVYRCTDRTLGYKWVQLADPSDLCSPPKGFLKLNISIVTKGELAVSAPTGSETTDDDNIEKNLFTMGARASSTDGWQTAKYSIKIFQAEQLPSASSSGFVTGFTRAFKATDAALLDPFIVAHFAGQQGRTTVKKATTNPEWNEQISFIDMFPPPCRRLAIQLRDSGISENLIACFYIDLYAVSHEGRNHMGGYLPVYGPCWVNLYGALDSSDEMATSYGDAQAFRGRILIELHTELLDHPDPTPISVVSDSCTPCDKSLLPVKSDLLLMCGIHNVDMIDNRFKDKPVQLQLSLGPYPELAQPSEIHQSRSKASLSVKTPSDNQTGGGDEKSEKVLHITPKLAVKSGDNDFGYIPLQGKKPLLAIHYNYEDKRKQATAINMLEKMAYHLEEGAFRARQAIKQQKADLAAALISRCLKTTVQRAATFTRLSKSTNVVGRQSRLFENWLKQCRDAMTDITATCGKTKAGLNHHTAQDAITTIYRLLSTFDNLLQPREQDFPDVFLWLIGPDGRKLAFIKVPARKLQYSEVPEECGVLSGRLETFKMLAPDRSNARIANVTISSWHGLYKEWFKSFELYPKGLTIPPSTFVPSSLTFKDSCKFQLRAYLYQARGIRGLDDTGLSDPFAVVHLQNRSHKTRVINETLSPIWDETLLIDNIELFGSRETIRERPSVITVLIYDYDDPETFEQIGVAHISPVVRFSVDVANYVPPQLQWFKLISPRTFAEAGEVLAAAELLEIADETPLPKLDVPEFEEHDLGKAALPVPLGIRPTLSRYRIEILFWGLRELSRVQLLSVDRPRLDIELSGQTIQSDVIQSAQSFPNFVCLVKAIEMDLPDNDIFCPPLMIRCVDCRSFGRQLLVGSAAVPNISAFFVASTEKISQSVSNFQSDMEEFTQEFADFAPRNSVSALAMSISKTDLQSSDNVLVDPVDKSDIEDILPAEDDRLADREKNRMYQKVKIKLLLPPLEQFGKRSTLKRSKAYLADVQEQVEDEEENDWWTKYYSTMEEIKQHEIDETNFTIGKSGGAKKFNKLFAKGTKKLKKMSDSGRENANQMETAFDNAAYEMGTDAISVKASSKATAKKQKEKNVRTFKMYQNELESYFHDFEDFLKSFELNRGKEDEELDPTQRKSNMTGKFKGNIRVSRLSSELVGQKAVRDEQGRSLLFTNMPPSTVVPVVVRVYVVRAHDLYPKDMNGKSDPYITIRLGKTVIRDKDNYVSKQLNPTFGRCFDIKATLPFDNMLTVQIFDWDLVGTDELIGETKIDIESRFYSKFRPSCGLPKVFERSGYNIWRDSSRPTHILSQMCRREGLEAPVYQNHKVLVGNKVFSATNADDDLLTDRNEHLALAVLNSWDQIGGYKLVPEHIENRLLFDPAQPGQVMGHLEMWVDIFPTDKGNIPPPLDISPRKPKSYELRCIIWNTEDVILDDVSITGERMSDIYVKGYLTGPEDTQQTDVHYRSLTGEGNFNWRFVFKFDYLSSEEKIVVKRKETMLSWDESEEKLPARLSLQVWDADLVGADDFLGSLVLDLNNMPRGAKEGSDCTADMAANDTKCPMTSLFKQRRMRGFWPFTVKNETTHELELVGKVEAEFQLLTAEEASTRPAGLGRDAPEALEKPNRPDTSFLWFTNPFKSLRYILCNKFKWLFIKLVIIGALSALFVLFIYSMPGWMGKKIVGA